MLLQQPLRASGNEKTAFRLKVDALRQQPVTGAHRVKKNDVYGQLRQQRCEIDIGCKLGLGLAVFMRFRMSPMIRARSALSASVARFAASSAFSPSSSRRYSR